MSFSMQSSTTFTAYRYNDFDEDIGFELPPGMPVIFPALVNVVPGTAVAKDISHRSQSLSV